MWREGLGAYKIITENKKGYRNHPATQEFIDAPYELWRRLGLVREEMLKRKYHPKDMPKKPYPLSVPEYEPIKEWQTLEEQIEILKAKGCKCDLPQRNTKTSN
jgi:hypothetical protein